MKITFFESKESLDTQQDLIVAATQQAIDSSPQMTGTPTVSRNVHQQGRTYLLHRSLIFIVFTVAYPNQ